MSELESDREELEGSELEADAASCNTFRYCSYLYCPSCHCCRQNISGFRNVDHCLVNYLFPPQMLDWEPGQFLAQHTYSYVSSAQRYII